MLYNEISTVCSDNCIKHTNTLCGQNLEFPNTNLTVHIAITML